MTIYRTLPTGPLQIALTVQPTTFASRLWLFVRQRWTHLWVVALVPFSIVLSISLSLFAGKESDSAWWLLKWGLLAGESVVFAPIVLKLVFEAMFPRPAESLLPQKIVFREDAIEVTAKKGATTIERWTWISLARETTFGFVLVLSQSPLVELAVPRSILTKPQVALFAKWLRQNGCIPS